MTEHNSQQFADPISGLIYISFKQTWRDRLGIHLPNKPAKCVSYSRMMVPIFQPPKIIFFLLTSYLCFP